MGKTTPQAKYNLRQRENTDLCYILTVFNYKAFGTTKAQYRNLVPNVSISPKFWDKIKQRATYNRAEQNAHIKINETLDAIANTLENIFRDFNAGCISPKDLELELHYRMGWKPRPVEVADDSKTLFGFMDAFIAERKPTGKTGTEKILSTWASLFKQFSNEHYGRLLDFNDIDADFFAALKTWCYAKPRKHSINYFIKGVSILKQIMRAAEKRKLHDNRQYQFFTEKKVATTQIALTFDELEALAALDLSETVGKQKARDLFLIGAYTGLRFSDFTRIRPEHIEANEKGKILNITTQKTDTTVHIPLLPVVEKILERYDYQAPKMPNQKLNTYLKELGKMAGINKKTISINTSGGKRNDEVLERWELLTTHVARRSFATNFYRMGFPASQLMYITGHTTEKQFMQYIKLDGKENAAQMANKMAEMAAPMSIRKKAI